MPLSKNSKRIIIAMVVCTIIAICIYIIVKRIREIINMDTQNKNVQAFLKMIRFAEGTDNANGYKIIFGGKTFSDFSKHPNIKVSFLDKRTNTINYSTAAGAYQILYSTWIRLALMLKLNDFSPENQDKAGIELIREKGALQDVINGNITTAISKVSKIWASMPGAGYKQPEKKIAELLTIYKTNGGLLT